MSTVPSRSRGAPAQVVQAAPPRPQNQQHSTSTKAGRSSAITRAICGQRWRGSATPSPLPATLKGWQGGPPDDDVDCVDGEFTKSDSCDLFIRFEDWFARPMPSEDHPVPFIRFTKRNGSIPARCIVTMKANTRQTVDGGTTVYDCESEQSIRLRRFGTRS